MSALTPYSEFLPYYSPENSPKQYMNTMAWNDSSSYEMEEGGCCFQPSGIGAKGNINFDIEVQYNGQMPIDPNLGGNKFFLPVTSSCMERWSSCSHVAHFVASLFTGCLMLPCWIYKCNSEPLADRINREARPKLNVFLEDTLNRADEEATRRIQLITGT